MKIVIQAVPCRRTMVDKLVGRLVDQGQTPEVFYDEGYNGPLWSMERIFEKYAGSGGILVLQDDTILPKWFMREFEASKIDGEVMSLFRGITTQQKELYDQGFSYATIPAVWGLANYYPDDFIVSYLMWTKDNPNRGRRHPTCSKIGDDLAIGQFMKQSKRIAYVTLPNLVNHQEAPSTVGNPRTVKGINRLSSLYGEGLLRPWDKTKVTKFK
jgi:hypothetical protein